MSLLSSLKGRLGAGSDAATGTAPSTHAAHYDALFADLQQGRGALDDAAMTSLIGFDGGGPVSMMAARDGSYFVTSELSVREDMTPSREGLRYEFALFLPVPESFASELFTFLARHFQSVPIGVGDTLTIGEIAPYGPMQARVGLMETKAEGVGIYVIELQEQHI